MVDATRPAGQSSAVNPPGWLLASFGSAAYALRIWAAMMLALYAAFWLELESASSAAVTVAILAQPKRGQALQKAVYRIGASVIGVAGSVLIVSLFSQSRDLFVVAYAAAMGCGVYVASFYDGNRAYGAVLSAYTIALVAVMQIDAPQQVFLSGLNRLAASVVGIASIALVNDAFAAPNVYPSVQKRLEEAHVATRALVADALAGAKPDAGRSVALLGSIVGIRPDLPGTRPREASDLSRRESCAADETGAETDPWSCGRPLGNSSVKEELPGSVFLGPRIQLASSDARKATAAAMSSG